jgi:hypothetical protein
MSELTCEWPLDVTACCPPGDDTDQDLVDAVIAEASALMTRLSGYTIGLCETTLRPLSECVECRKRCCGGADGIRLEEPHGIWIQSVTEVRDGIVVVPEASYRFDADKQVLWSVPPGRWPRRDSRWAECGTEGAFCVDVVLGATPDAYDLSVANSLACELLKDCTGQKCRLPRNTTQVTGQGITITMSDTDLLGLLPEVAGWQNMVNPDKVPLPARVWSPELDR